MPEPKPTPDPCWRPSCDVTLDPDGTLHASATIPAVTLRVAGGMVGAINWQQVLQWLVTYGPQIMALVMAIINGINPPKPTPSPPTPTPPAH